MIDLFKYNQSHLDGQIEVSKIGETELKLVFKDGTVDFIEEQDLVQRKEVLDAELAICENLLSVMGVVYNKSL